MSKLFKVAIVASTAAVLMGCAQQEAQPVTVEPVYNEKWDGGGGCAGGTAGANECYPTSNPNGEYYPPGQDPRGSGDNGGNASGSAT